MWLCSENGPGKSSTVICTVCLQQIKEGYVAPSTIDSKPFCFLLISYKFAYPIFYEVAKAGHLRGFGSRSFVQDLISIIDEIALNFVYFYTFRRTSLEQNWHLGIHDQEV